MFKRKKTTKNKAPKPARVFFIDAMTLFTIASAFALFSNRLGSQTETIKVYAPKSGPYFFIYKYGSSYLHNVLEWLAKIIQTPDAFGWAVIILTVFIKFISLFNRLIVAKMSINASQRQSKLAPQLNYLKQLLQFEPLTSKQSKQLLSLKSECLQANQAKVKKYPYLINMVISILTMTALYQSIAYSSTINDIYFLGINLSQRSVWLTLLSSILYALSSGISWHYLDPQAKKTNSILNYFITPVTTFFSGYFLPSIITLYWITSASCLCLQYLFTYNIIYPLFRKQALANFKPKIIVTKEKIAAILKQQ